MVCFSLIIESYDRGQTCTNAHVFKKKKTHQSIKCGAIYFFMMSYHSQRRWLGIKYQQNLIIKIFKTHTHTHAHIGKKTLYNVV